MISVVIAPLTTGILEGIFGVSSEVDAVDAGAMPVNVPPLLLLLLLVAVINKLTSCVGLVTVCEVAILSFTLKVNNFPLFSDGNRIEYFPSLPTLALTPATETVPLEAMFPFIVTVPEIKIGGIGGNSAKITVGIAKTNITVIIISCLNLLIISYFLLITINENGLPYKNGIIILHEANNRIPVS